MHGEIINMVLEQLDFDKLWNYNDPKGTRDKFEELLSKAIDGDDESYYLQLLTQIARTYGLEANFDAAHKVLFEVESKLSDDLDIVRVRYLLERGRAYRSDNKPERAIPFFTESFQLAKKVGADFYAVDAAHMVAIAEPDPLKQYQWNLDAIEIAEKSKEARARNWLGSLYNNMGWSYHDGADFEKALDMFEKALVAHEEKGREGNIKIARWSVARCLRSLERIDEALEIQLALYEEEKVAGSGSGYTEEELGELYLIKEDTAQAESFFAASYQVLSKDIWLVRNEPSRLERLKKLGKVN